MMSPLTEASIIMVAWVAIATMTASPGLIAVGVVWAAIVILAAWATR